MSPLLLPSIGHLLTRKEWRIELWWWHLQQQQQQQWKFFRRISNIVKLWLERASVFGQCFGYFQSFWLWDPVLSLITLGPGLGCSTKSLILNYDRLFIGVWIASNFAIAPLKMHRWFSIHSHVDLSLVIPNNKTLEQWRLKVTYCLKWKRDFACSASQHRHLIL